MILLIVLFACCCMPVTTKGQTNVLHRTFSFTETVFTPIESDNDLTFVNCYAIKGNILQVGGGSGENLKMGSVTTRELGLNGNATLLIRVKGPSIKYRVSAYNGDKIIMEKEFITSNAISHPNAILLQNGCTSTTLKIEGIDGKFDLISIDVYDIGASYFYESFNFMEDDEHESFSGNGMAQKNSFDNYNHIELNDIVQSEGCVFFRVNNYSKYRLLSLPTINSDKAILSFKLSRGNQPNVTPSFTISSSEGVKFGPINTLDVNNALLGNSCSIDNTCYPDYTHWNNYFVVVSGMTSYFQIAFTGESVFLDDVRLTPYPIIDETSDNSTMIANNVGLCTVTLKRTLCKDYWNTLCLPYDITKENFEEETGTSAEIRTLGSVINGVFYFEKVATDATIDAGTPFIVKVKKDVVNPQFSNVLIKNVEAKAVSDLEGNSYKFVGTFSPVNLTTDKTNLFLGTDGILHYPASESVSTMKGLRAYFVVPSGTVPSRVNINGEEMDAIGNIDVESNTDAAVYDLHGQRHHAGALHNGIYICNGRKVIVK